MTAYSKALLAGTMALDAASMARGVVSGTPGTVVSAEPWSTVEIVRIVLDAVYPQICDEGETS